ncbi:MAG: glycosyltransferase [Gemmatimonadetes bacterium]|nr:glycosyltransferase [Gemmatimonadota bacterium]
MTDPNPRPLISIVTVSLNARALIEQTMRSVLIQKAADVEYVVIDGGSTDGTVDVIRHHAEDLDFWVSEPDRGISDAFNKGIQATQGEVVGILNAGDWYEPGALEAVRRVRHPEERFTIYHGDMAYHHEDGRHAWNARASPEHIWKYMSMFHPTMFVEREVYRRLGMFLPEFRYAMDSEFVHRCVRAGVRFAYLPRIQAHMRLGGKSGRNFRKSLLDFRDSAIRHGAPRIPSYYRCFSATVQHALLRYWWGRKLKQLRDGLGLGPPRG